MPRLVLVHGFLGSAANWGPVLHRFRHQPELSDWTFEALDLLGHGHRKADPEAPFNLDAIAKDLLNQIEGGGSCVALGHSFGVRPLLKISTLRPGLLRALIVEDSSPVLSEAGFAELRRIFEVPVPFRTRDDAKADLGRRFGDDSRLARFLLSNIRERPEGHTWRFDTRLNQLLEDSVSEALWSEWETFLGPVHLILGSRSSFVPPERVSECLRVRQGRPTFVHSLENTGHWAHADDPEGFVKLITQILTNL